MIIISVCIIILLLIVDRWKSSKLKEVHSQLGNDTLYLPVIGHAYNFLGSNEDRMNVLQRSAWQAFGRKHGAASMWMGNKLLIQITDPEIAAAILKTMHDKEYIHNMMKHLLGNGTVFTSHDIWQRRRKILVPSFSSRYLSKFVYVFEANAKVVAEKIMSEIGKGNFSCWKYLCPYALDSLCETALGVNINIQNQTDHPFFKSFQEYFKNVASRLCQPWLQLDAIYKLLPVSKQQNKHKEIMYNFIDNLIYKKKALLYGDTIKQEEIEDVTTGRANIKTFLESMIETSKETDKGYTHEELREEILVLALAGTDTSAAGTCYTLVMLSQHADVQEKVYNEIIEVFGNSDKPIEMGDLLKLKYMDAVIKETMRLYPPTPIITRHCTKDLELHTGLILPSGCDIVINIWGIHRNPFHWGADAQVFRPERFLSGPLPIPSAFLPFSNGPRNCVGYQYALLSMKATLTILLRNYRFLPATSFKFGKMDPLRVSFDVMMKHVDNFEVQVELRNKNTGNTN